ncbi:hypothetical protein RND71_004484 [Anisodus tanguticus]|uniref:F-box associated beta-propeller type 3 domain-containing protein n=1 Tax=Anisodus tanguticus TaxID=243964 RepID=A0AAE1VLS3_9SOLA|nr:hypothetical protein RND71_004484 [Anisodus tanguticus]
MRDYGVKESWNQFAIQGTDLYPIIPKYRFLDGDVLLHYRHLERTGCVFKTSKESSVLWPQSDSERVIQNGFVYTESLISPKLLRKRIVKHSKKAKQMDVDGAMGILFQEEIIMDILSRLPDIQKLDWPSIHKPWSCRLYCCYDGLALIGVGNYPEYKHHILFLWNPSTRESIVLPDPKFSPKDFYICGLGYDSTSDDYKILKIDGASRNEILALKGGS